MVTHMGGAFLRSQRHQCICTNTSCGLSAIAEFLDGIIVNAVNALAVRRCNQPALCDWLVVGYTYLDKLNILPIISIGKVIILLSVSFSACTQYATLAVLFPICR